VRLYGLDAYFQNLKIIVLYVVLFAFECRHLVSSRIYKNKFNHFEACYGTNSELIRIKIAIHFLSSLKEEITLLAVFWVKNDYNVRQNACDGTASFLVNNNNTRNWIQEKHNDVGFRYYICHDKNSQKNSKAAKFSTSLQGS